MNRDGKLPILAALLVALTVSCTRLNAQSPHETIQKFFKDYFEAKLNEEPEFATVTGHFENADKWNDWSKAGRDQRRVSREDTLRDLDKFSLTALSDEDQLSARLLRYELRAELESNELETYLLRVRQLNGAHNLVYTTIDRMPARNLRDYQNILARLHGVPVYVDQNIGIMNEAIERGIVQPEVVVDLVIKQIEAQAAQDQATTPLLEAFRKFPSAFPEDQQKKLRDEAVATYEHEFVPAWQKLLEYMKTTYAPKARPAFGLISL